MTSSRRSAGTRRAGRLLVCDNSVMLCEVAGGRLQRLTQRSAQPPSADAVVFSPDGKKVAFMREIAGFNQIFVVEV